METLLSFWVLQVSAFSSRTASGYAKAASLLSVSYRLHWLTIRSLFFPKCRKSTYSSGVISERIAGLGNCFFLFFFGGGGVGLVWGVAPGSGGLGIAPRVVLWLLFQREKMFGF